MSASSRFLAASASICCGAAEMKTSTGAPCSICSCKVPDAPKFGVIVDVRMRALEVLVDRRQRILQAGGRGNRELDRGSPRASPARGRVPSRRWRTKGDPACEFHRLLGSSGGRTGCAVSRLYAIPHAYR